MCSRRSLEFNLLEVGALISEWKQAYLCVFLSLFSPSVCLSDLQASLSFEHYSISDKPMDYRILQMDEDQDRMYVGCKDHVLSMDINNITHGTLKVSRCLLFQSVNTDSPLSPRQRRK